MEIDRIGIIFLILHHKLNTNYCISHIIKAKHQNNIHLNILYSRLSYCLKNSHQNKMCMKNCQRSSRSYNSFDILHKFLQEILKGKKFQNKYLHSRKKQNPNTQGTSNSSSCFQETLYKLSKHCDIKHKFFKKNLDNNFIMDTQEHTNFSKGIFNYHMYNINLMMN